MTGGHDPVGEMVGTETEVLAEQVRALQERAERSAVESAERVERELRERDQRLLSLIGSFPERLGHAEEALAALRRDLGETQKATAEAQEEARSAQREVATLTRERERLVAERHALARECERLRQHPTLPAGQLHGVSGAIERLFATGVVDLAVPASAVDRESLSDAYAVGEWVFSLVSGELEFEGDDALELDPPLTLLEADQFAARHRPPPRIGAVLLGVVDPTAARVVGGCSLYATEAQARTAQQRLGGELRVFGRPAAIDEAIRWCETDLAALNASGATAERWLRDVRGLQTADHRHQGGRLWLFDGPPGGAGRLTPRLQEAVAALHENGFRLKQARHRRYGPSYFFEPESKDPSA